MTEAPRTDQLKHDQNAPKFSTLLLCDMIICFFGAGGAILLAQRTGFYVEGNPWSIGAAVPLTFIFLYALRLREKYTEYHAAQNFKMRVIDELRKDWAKSGARHD